MPKNNNAVPTSILSFVRKSMSTGSGDEDDDDQALLIPSRGSSFNLTGDSNVILPKSTSHHSNHSRSTKSSKSSISRAMSNASSGSSSGHIHHHHHHSGVSGKGRKKKRRDFDTSHSRGGSLSSRRLSEHSSSNFGSRGSSSKKSSQGRHRRPHSFGNDEREHTEPLRGSNDGVDFPLKKSSSMGQDADDYLVGYDSDHRALSPIQSSSFHSDHSGTSSNSRSGLRKSPEIDWSTRSTSNNTIHSGKSYRSKKSASSNRSGKSRQQYKLKRAEKRREWVRRWRRRRLLGTMLLTVVYSLLFAYTMLITLGPLALHFRDPMEWCPHNYLWEDSHYGESEMKHPDVHLNIDQLQQSRQRQQQDGDEHQRRRLSSDGVAFATTEDLKKVEINLLRKTSKDVHSNENDGSRNNHNQNVVEQQSASGEESTHKYENPDYNDSPCHTTRVPFLFYLTLEECDLSRRMAASVLLGGFIGYERRASDRPAGIRTMALVSLGSCFFTISSQLAFRDSPMTWDASRVTAAVPSGVGFLGAGLIWKGSLSDGGGGEVHQVHGITTAASVWLAAAVGVGAGGALYAVSAYSTALIILVLRFGPRLYLQNDRGFDYDDEDEDEEDSDEDDDKDGPDVNRKYNMVPEERIPSKNIEKSDTTHSDNYEMHLIGQSINDTTTLKNNSEGYGATDVEQNAVAHLLQEDQKRQTERMSQLGVGDNPNNGPPFLSWLTNLLPGKERQQPLNPYQEISRDREVLRLMKKKKSMSRMSSRPSYST